MDSKAMVPCPRCEGKGVYYVESSPEGRYRSTWDHGRCWDCAGTGQVEYVSPAQREERVRRNAEAEAVFRSQQAEEERRQRRVRDLDDLTEAIARHEVAVSFRDSHGDEAWNLLNQLRGAEHHHYVKAIESIRSGRRDAVYEALLIWGQRHG